ncbi:MAG: FixH family protein [Sorangiineae bacterium]|nr:FixH family protein [Polyangiaceae bacterium]MEB2324407.1 FixH family protein [Sorangiineae bacterium]
MTITRLSAALGFLLALGSTACGGSEHASEGVDASDALKSQSGAYLVRYTPIPDPPVTGKNQLTLELTRAKGGAVDDATLEVTPWMPAMGHGSPVQPTVQNLGSGRYSVDDLGYTMPGRWEVQVALTDARVVDQVVIELDVR